MFIDIILEPAFEKTIKKIKDDKTKQLILTQLHKLKENPFIGKQLSGNLNGIYSLGFGAKPQYRIIYEIQPCPECGQDKQNTLSCSASEMASSSQIICTVTLILHDVVKREDAY
jgi:mRNA-degrading endonuclease RelE of RelBE toxin-antitoxin system